MDDLNKDTNSIASDISQSFVALQAIIEDGILKKINPEIDKINLRVDNNEQIKPEMIDKTESLAAQFKRDVDLIADKANQHIEQQDLRMTEFFSKLKNLCDSAVAKG